MSIQALRGMHDILPTQSGGRRWLEQQLVAMAIRYGYREIRTPIIESPELFVRSIGEVTDIVEKEMYIFSVRGDKSIALRPEYTAGCARALMEHGLLRQEQKMWYLGQMFRYERPQAGRYREFNQFGIEHFGGQAPWSDILLLTLTNRLWKTLGIAPQLEINSIGKPEQRQQYNQQLVAYLTQHKDALDANSQQRMHTNPLRVLDSKNQATIDVLAQAPQLMSFLDKESRETFEQIQTSLDALGITWRYNPRLVRGLDYYNDLVFEWTTDQLGSQSALCAGGRYDGLAVQLGSKQSVPAVGFALGIERLELLLQKNQRIPEIAQADIFFICNLPEERALICYEQLHQLLPAHTIGCDVSGSSLKSQFKKADKSGAMWALIVGEEESANDMVSIKFLRQQQEQIQLPTAQLSRYFQQQLET